MSDRDTREADAGSTDSTESSERSRLVKSTSSYTTEIVDNRERLSVRSKICFAIGGIPYQMTGTSINFFLSVFLLEVAEMDPIHVSVIAFGGRAWDAITDPVCGYLVNRTNTRLGKLMPWILFNMPFAVVVYFFLWYVPDISEGGKLAYYVFCYCIFQALLTCLHVPYTSLTMCISGRQDDRDSATAFRSVAEIVGIVLSVVIQGQLIARHRIAGECGEKQKPTEEQIHLQEVDYSISAGILAGIYLLSVLITFFGVKEIRDLQHEDREPFFHGLKLCFTHGTYVKLTCAFLFSSLGIQVVQSNLTLFLTYSVGLGDYFSIMLLVLLLVSVVCIPFWQKCLLRFGKKSTFAAGMIILIPIFYLQLYAPDPSPVWLGYVTMVLAGIGVSVAMLLPWSMLPDVLDEYQLMTGTRRDAVFYSFYVFFNKFAVGVSIGLSQLALSIGGYVQGGCSQPKSVGLTLRLLCSPAPVVFLLISLIFLWKYPLTEERRKIVRKGLLEQAEQEGTETIGNLPITQSRLFHRNSQNGSNLNRTRITYDFASV